MFKKEEKNLEAMRHSCEHVLTMAMLRLWPGKIKAAMGPATEDGFYFDFDSGIRISEDDFRKIEKEMTKIIKEDLPITKDKMTVDEARKLFSGNTYKDNEYKHEWLDQIEERGEKVNIYWMGEKNGDIPETFVDICSGPHIKSTGKIGAFKLLKVAGAYWHGDEKNKMLQRIYGTCFETKEELDDYLKKLEEAEKRDHRKLGKELDLFVFSDIVGKGLPLWTPKGAIVRRVMENFVIEEETKRGYLHVVTPELANIKLYEKSGHYPYYKDTMYPPMEVDEDKLILRPMTCPHHFMLYKDKIRSYRDLPLRIAELGKLFRYERSGTLTGLIRARSFCLADAHIFCRQGQVKEVIKEVIDLIEFMAITLGFQRGEHFWYRLSLGDRKNKKKYYDDPKGWKHGEKVLKEVLDEVKAPYEVAEDEAAFYGPKIDVQMKNVLGKEDTAFTVQYDSCMPDRFDLTYTNEKGEEEKCVVIHRSSIGAIERVFAFLLEFYAGALPVWLSPVQIQIINVSDAHAEFCKNLAEEFKAENIRVELDLANETVGNKIRKAVKQKVPYMLVIGDREMNSKNLHVRIRGKEEVVEMSKGDFVNRIKDEIKNHK